MSAPLQTTQERPVAGQQEGKARLTWGVRLALVFIAVCLVGVFSVAIYLDPYDADGKPRDMGTHEQLGLPECTFKSLTGKPCPSCGLTTSFALLLHLDVLNSLQANYVGTLLAAFLLVVLPWAVASLVRNRLVGIWSLERPLTWTVAVFLTLLMLRWAIIML